MRDLGDVLDERGETHGNYSNVATTAQQIKNAMYYFSRNKDVACKHELKESLDMIASKLARIVNGDGLHIDHWQDIMGYAQLAINAIDKINEKGDK